jgi:hypothetical protein
MSGMSRIELHIALHSMQWSGEAKRRTFSHGLEGCSIWEPNKIVVDERSTLKALRGISRG